jgi:hypothetical protein
MTRKPRETYELDPNVKHVRIRFEAGSWNWSLGDERSI